ncbi:MAG: lytic murein transglycosylase B, partial [Pseudomonadota bacterium]
MLLVFGLPATAAGIDLSRDDVAAFVDTLVDDHGFERGAVEDALAGIETNRSILDAISRPAERVRPWHEYREIFLTDERIAAGVEFWDEHADTLGRISRDTGVPEDIIVGIIGVETYFGRITGRYPVLESLVTLGFDYPPRAAFFLGELEEFFLLSREQDLPLTTTLGSYAGAMGRSQFISSSYREYAADGDGDDRIDLFESWPDVIASVANYFVRHDWRPGEPVIAPAKLGRDHTLALPAKNSLRADSTVGELRAAGARFETRAGRDAAARFIVLDGKRRNEYWVGLHNFYVITRST